ncbi:DNA polymerase III subunit gamma/tau [Hyalangium sp.]|uniref:DNA polymerase III subunit gamma/tau n=1 Tax=Hyalangium sp. TaxID=2028555 RepID=UPI003899A1F8
MEGPQRPGPDAPAGATPLSRVTEPAPEVRVTNARRPAEPEAAEDERLFAEEGSAEGCASGDCLPEAPAESAPEPEPEVSPPPPSHGRDNPGQSAGERWRAAVESVKAASARHGTALANGRLLWLRAGEIGVGYVPAASFHRTQVAGGTGRAMVEKALAEHFGRPMKLVVEDATGEAASAPSLAEQDAQARSAYQQSTEGKVRTHPAIRAVLKHLGGEIEHIQVLEPERPPASPSVESPEESA